jgi:hypothetical protein
MRAIIPLDNTNYRASVDVKIGVLIVFGNGDAPEELQATAKALDGFGRVAYLDMDTQADLLEALDLTADTAPAFRASHIGEETEFADFDTMEEAVADILENVPDGLAEVFPDERAFHPFLSKTLQEGGLAVMLLSEESKMPKLFQKLALWMGDMYKYAVFANPNEEVKKQFGVTELPQLIIMLPQPVRWFALALGYCKADLHATLCMGLRKGGRERERERERERGREGGVLHARALV